MHRKVPVIRQCAPVDLASGVKSFTTVVQELEQGVNALTWSLSAAESRTKWKLCEWSHPRSRRFPRPRISSKHWNIELDTRIYGTKMHVQVLAMVLSVFIEGQWYHVGLDLATASMN